MANFRYLANFRFLTLQPLLSDSPGRVTVRLGNRKVGKAKVTGLNDVVRVGLVL